MNPLDWSNNPAVVPPTKPVIVVSIQDKETLTWLYISEVSSWYIDGEHQPRHAMHFNSIPSKLIFQLVAEGYKVAIELYEAQVND